MMETTSIQLSNVIEITGRLFDSGAEYSPPGEGIGRPSMTLSRRTKTNVSRTPGVNMMWNP